MARELIPSNATIKAVRQGDPRSLRPQACDADDQVAANLKHCAPSPLDLARFIHGRVAAGESNAFIAKRLAIDATTVAHDLTLLQLSPELEAVRDSGRCTSPRTVHELQHLQAEESQAVAHCWRPSSR